MNTAGGQQPVITAMECRETSRSLYWTLTLIKSSQRQYGNHGTVVKMMKIMKMRRVDGFFKIATFHPDILKTVR